MMPPAGLWLGLGFFVVAQVVAVARTARGLGHDRAPFMRESAQASVALVAATLLTFWLLDQVRTLQIDHWSVRTVAAAVAVAAAIFAWRSDHSRRQRTSTRFVASDCSKEKDEDNRRGVG